MKPEHLTRAQKIVVRDEADATKREAARLKAIAIHAINNRDYAAAQDETLRQAAELARTKRDDVLRAIDVAGLVAEKAPSVNTVKSTFLQKLRRILWD